MRRVRFAAPALSIDGEQQRPKIAIRIIS